MKPTKKEILDKFDFINGSLIRKDNGYGGYKRNDGYIFQRICGIPFGVHRLIFFIVNGFWPYQVDHKNGIRWDNHPDNLRAATHAQNCMNRATRAKSGVKGCYWNELRKKWMVQVSIDGKRKTIGYFHSLDDAKIAFENASLESYGEFARVY